MPAAMDTSILIHTEKAEGFERLHSHDESYYIPAHATAEFLLGAHLSASAHFREPARDAIALNYV